MKGSGHDLEAVEGSLLQCEPESNDLALEGFQIASPPARLVTQSVHPAILPRVPSAERLEGLACAIQDFDRIRTVRSVEIQLESSSFQSKWSSGDRANVSGCMGEADEAVQR